MIVSWNWLKDYVDLKISHDELVERLSMSGLNYEGTEDIEGDLAVDLEVTSNRPDCLGHIGVAREIAVLYRQSLAIPKVELSEAKPAVREVTKVSIECPKLCPRYTARVIRGVKVGPSPEWLVERLRTLGIASINNVVDVTNYVMMENGQPLHAFDLGKLAGPEIIVREAVPGEQFRAINHKAYELKPGMYVIADAERSVALAGVMGGADTEVSESTADLLIESAEFAPLSVRTTARALSLHSPSSYRFERGVDPVGTDWASRRCCQLILELAGGELAEGVIDVGQPVTTPEPVVLRLSQLERVLGIVIEPAEVRRILTELGCEESKADADGVTVVPPTWRRDLIREIDLVEEVARIHGYDQIPEDVGVPMVPSHRSDEDRVLSRVRTLLTGAGMDEAMTASVVSSEWNDRFSPWTDVEPMQASTPMLMGADRLRRSLTPSLLESRRLNQSLGNSVIELFETARVFLPQKKGRPHEQWTLAITSGRDYYGLKGVIEALVVALDPALVLDVVDTQQKLFDPAQSARLEVSGRLLGYLGEVSDDGLKQAGLRSGTTIAELDLSVLVEVANLIPQHVNQSPYPPIERDLNLIVDEQVRWSELAATVHAAGGECLEAMSYQETYRDPEKDGPGKKRQLFSITLRSAERTLTNEEADQIREDVVAACSKAHQAELLGG